VEISDELADALAALVAASDAAEAAPGDRQAARRAIEWCAIVAKLARDEGIPDRLPGPAQGQINT
jgi:hypothetical protein